MEHTTDAIEMVDLMSCPAFCVKDGIIIKVNPAAQGRMINAGSAVAPLLKTGVEEYTALGEGSLYLALSLSGQEVGACVCRRQDFDLFLLDREPEDSELHTLALAARELREPLSSLMVSSNLLFSKNEITDPNLREQVLRMNRSMYQILRLVGNMSDAVRYADSGTSTQEIRDIRAIVSEALSQAAELASHAGIRLEQELHPEPIFSLVDAEKLERAFFNMLSNAMKFTPGGETVHVSLVKRDQMFCLSVRDTGCGIPEPLRGNVFTRYNREVSLEDSRFGIGLGLVLIRSVAILHGGSVLVDHPEGKGTRITMALPILPGNGTTLRSPVLRVDYAGELDHGLVEFSELLPAELYDPKK